MTGCWHRSAPYAGLNHQTMGAQLLIGLLEVTGARRAACPIDDLVQALLPIGLRSEAQRCANMADVGDAVANIALAKLPSDRGGDLGATEQAGERAGNLIDWP